MAETRVLEALCHASQARWETIRKNNGQKLNLVLWHRMWSYMQQLNCNISPFFYSLYKEMRKDDLEQRLQTANLIGPAKAFCLTQMECCCYYLKLSSCFKLQEFSLSKNLSSNIFHKNWKSWHSQRPASFRWLIQSLVCFMHSQPTSLIF